MNNLIKSKKGCIHLYNPKQEGVGAYDVHYINAYKKNKISKNRMSMKDQKRYAA